MAETQKEMEGLHGCTEESKLYDAAAMGITRALEELLRNDGLLLNRVSFTTRNKTPLYVAAMKGHLGFVQEILRRSPQLAEDMDFNQSSALHIASAEGHEDIVRELLRAANHMCTARDSQGRTPLHLAIMKGRVRVLKLLIGANRIAAARERIDRGLTLLHICVKYAQVECLKVLVQEFSELIDAKDDDGNTLLHMAIWSKQTEIIQYLVEIRKVNMEVENSDGNTALDILEHNRFQKDEDATEIRRILQSDSSQNTTGQTRPEKWLTKKRDSIMVVAVLIATMAFQAGVTPAGGVWPDDLDADPNPHRAGEAVMAYNHPRSYRNFMRANTVAFVSSLSIILLLISGLPFRNRLFLWILMVIMWLTATSIAITYGISVVAVTPAKDRKSMNDVMQIAIPVWCGVMGLLLVGNTARLIDRWLKSRGIHLWRPKRFRRCPQVKV